MKGRTIYKISIMQKLILLTYLILFSSFGNAQTCNYKKLSRTFDFIVGLQRKQQDATVSVIVVAKSSNKTVQTIQFYSEFIFDTDFKDCNAVRSYSTGINKDITEIDNDFGTFIVADFNFDGKEDFAIKKDSGGNGGPLYRYYLQENGQFKLDVFLSDTMGFFPSEINPDTKTLVTLVHANAYQLSKNSYQYNPKAKNWKKKKTTFLTYE